MQGSRHRYIGAREGFIMLVLTRKADAGDSSIITVGEDVEVTVLEVRGDSVRIGITAPRETVVDRKEVWMQKHGQRTETSS